MGNAECGQAPRKAVVKLDGSQPWDSPPAEPDDNGECQDCCCARPACERVVKLSKVPLMAPQDDDAVLFPQTVLRPCVPKDNVELRARARLALEITLFGRGEAEEGDGEQQEAPQPQEAPPDELEVEEEEEEEREEAAEDEAADGAPLLPAPRRAPPARGVAEELAADEEEEEEEALARQQQPRAAQRARSSPAVRAAPRRGGPAYDDWQFSEEGDPPGEPTLLLARFKALPVRSCRKEEPDLGQAWHSLEAYALEASGLMAAALLVEQACCEVQPAPASRVQTLSTVTPRDISASSQFVASSYTPLMVPAISPGRVAGAGPLGPFYISGRSIGSDGSTAAASGGRGPGAWGLAGSSMSSLGTGDVVPVRFYGAAAGISV